MLSERKRSDKNWGWSEMGRDGWRRPLFLSPPFFLSPEQTGDVEADRFETQERRRTWHPAGAVITKGGSDELGRRETLQDVRSALFPLYLQRDVRIVDEARAKKREKKPKKQRTRRLPGKRLPPDVFIWKRVLKIPPQIDLRPNSNCRILFMYNLFIYFDISVTFPQAAKHAFMVKLKLCLI